MASRALLFDRATAEQAPKEDEPLLLTHSNAFMAVALSLAIIAIGTVVIQLLLL